MPDSRGDGVEDSDAKWVLGGYLMWLTGSLLFAVVSYRNDDMLSLIGSVLFFFGIIAVMIPLRRSAPTASHGTPQKDPQKQ